MVSESSAKQFAVVKQLISQADEIIHAGDPDREGQLLVDEVLEYVRCNKPVQRILLNALDEKSIREAIDQLKPNAQFFNLRQSALGRARADWLIGMNLSRAYTMAAQRSGHRKLVLPIGRVKTPTLALVVRRERLRISSQWIISILRRFFSMLMDSFRLSGSLMKCNRDWTPRAGWWISRLQRPS